MKEGSRFDLQRATDRFFVGLDEARLGAIRIVTKKYGFEIGEVPLGLLDINPKDRRGSIRPGSSSPLLSGDPRRPQFDFSSTDECPGQRRTLRP